MSNTANPAKTLNRLKLVCMGSRGQAAQSENSCGEPAGKDLGVWRSIPGPQGPSKSVADGASAFRQLEPIIACLQLGDGSRGCRQRSSPGTPPSGDTTGQIHPHTCHDGRTGGSSVCEINTPVSP